MNIECPNCEVPATLIRDRITTVWKRTPVTIDDERYQCPVCGEEFYTLAQSTQHSDRVLAAYDAAHPEEAK